MSLTVKIGLALGLGYAVLSALLSGESLTHPLAGVLIALFAALWQLHSDAGDARTATELLGARSAELENAIADVRGVLHGVPVTRASDFPTFVQAIRSTLRHAESYYNNTRAIHHSGEIPEEADYFALYRQRANDNEVSMKRLVHLGSRPAYEQAKRLVSELSGANRFELRVWTGRSFPLSFELMLADNSVVLAFASAAGEPELCMRVIDPDFARKMNEFFLLRLWDAPETEVVKRAGRMSPTDRQNALGRLKTLYEAATQLCD
jgi:hypothetical protein